MPVKDKNFLDVFPEDRLESEWYGSLDAAPADREARGFDFAGRRVTDDSAFYDGGYDE